MSEVLRIDQRFRVEIHPPDDDPVICVSGRLADVIAYTQDTFPEMLETERCKQLELKVAALTAEVQASHDRVDSLLRYKDEVNAKRDQLARRCVAAEERLAQIKSILK